MLEEDARGGKGMTADFMHELDLVHLRNCKQDMHMIYERETFIAVFLVFTSTHYLAPVHVGK